jgi:hypothetical protein
MKYHPWIFRIVFLPAMMIWHHQKQEQQQMMIGRLRLL